MNCVPGAQRRGGPHANMRTHSSQPQRIPCRAAGTRCNTLTQPNCLKCASVHLDSSHTTGRPACAAGTGRMRHKRVLTPAAAPKCRLCLVHHNMCVSWAPIPKNRITGNAVAEATPCRATCGLAGLVLADPQLGKHTHTQPACRAPSPAATHAANPRVGQPTTLCTATSISPTATQEWLCDPQRGGYVPA
jgi:hypothetical protein